MTSLQTFVLTIVTFGLGISVSQNHVQARPTKPTSEATTKSCNHYVGNSSAGQAVTVNLCSISRVGNRQVDFTYYLNDEPIASRANCTEGSWTTFPERQTHTPQSRATQSMISSVCRSESEIAIVFDPPSNVRVSPNGGILCTLDETGALSIFGSTGEWYYTNACGDFGVIHSSQLRF